MVLPGSGKKPCPNSLTLELFSFTKFHGHTGTRTKDSHSDGINEIAKKYYFVGYTGDRSMKLIY